MTSARHILRVMATRTNEHIRRGNAAIVAGDLELAKSEFYKLLMILTCLRKRLREIG